MAIPDACGTEAPDAGTDPRFPPSDLYFDARSVEITSGLPATSGESNVTFSLTLSSRGFRPDGEGRIFESAGESSGREN